MAEELLRLIRKMNLVAVGSGSAKVREIDKIIY